MSTSKTNRLPLDQYAAKQGVLACLLLSSFCLLPRSQWPSAPPANSPSSDRPEWQFLVPITSNPRRTMAFDVLGVSLCMLWWSPTLRQWWATDRLADRNARARQTLLRCAEAGFMTVISTVAIVLGLFALGASLERRVPLADIAYVSHAVATLLFALHLSILVVWPVIYTVGTDFVTDSRSSSHYRMIRIFCEFRCTSPLERAILYPAIGAITGAWLGAIAFPLDWDRPWQSYPLPPAIGSILGYSVAGTLCWARSSLETLMAES